MEIRFALIYAELHECFWARIDRISGGLQIIAGVLALAGAFKDPVFLSGTGIFLAVLGGVQLWLRPLEVSYSFRDTRRELHTLNGKAWGLPQNQVEADLEEIISKAPRGWGAFTRLAQNKAWAENGYEPPFKLSVQEKVIGLLA